MKNHLDGTPCLKGLQDIPENYNPCCEDFDDRTYVCIHDIRYEWWPERQGWFIPIHASAGSGGIAMGYCPHCGHKLVSQYSGGRYISLDKMKKDVKRAIESKKETDER